MESAICNCIALYNWDTDIELGILQKLAVDFFGYYQIQPHVATITTGVETVGPLEYSKALACLREFSQSPRASIELYHTLKEYKQLAFGWDAYTLLDTLETKTALFCVSADYSGQDLTRFDRFIAKFIEHGTVSYGIGFKRPLLLGPTFYALGISSGLRFSDAEMAEADRIGNWLREQMGAKRYLHGYLRDVYPINVLSESHMQMPVGDCKFEEWVHRRDDRGTIEQIARTQWIWKVPDVNISAVRQELMQFNLLIAELVVDT